MTTIRTGAGRLATGPSRILVAIGLGLLIAGTACMFMPGLTNSNFCPCDAMPLIFLHKEFPTR